MKKELCTNDVEALSDVIHYHCLNCNHQFFETKQQRALYQYRSSKNGPSMKLGTIVIVLVIATIFAVKVKEKTENDNRYILG